MHGTIYILKHKKKITCIYSCTEFVTSYGGKKTKYTVTIQQVSEKFIDYLAQQQIGIIITDHNVRDTLDLCDTACILSHGSIIASGDAATLLQDPKERAVYLGDQFTI
jgi:ABC-type cobalamin transport system ATPase subunit